MNNLQPNNKTNHWMISLGAVAIPEQFYVDRNPQIEEPEKTVRTVSRIRIPRPPGFGPVKRVEMSRDAKNAMKHQILIALNSGIKASVDIYDFVEKSGDLPMDGSSSISYARFCVYVAQVRNKYGIVKDTDEVVRLFDAGTSILEICAIVDKNKNSVMTILNRRKRYVTGKGKPRGIHAPRH